MLESWVLPQRLRPPGQRPDELARSRLVEEVLATEAPAVVVQAGAGYGMTTLLAQIAAADPRRSGWLTLDPSDDDPVVLLRHVVAALSDAGVDVTAIGPDLIGLDPDGYRMVLPSIAQAMDRPRAPFLLVLDDMHLLSNAESVRFIGGLVGLVTAGSTVLIAGRTLHDLPLARWELDGRLLRIGESDLAYTSEEAHLVLNNAVPELSERLEADVMRVSEGWPAGLHLAILALREHPDPPVLVEGLLVSNRRVIDYLHQEVLARLEPDLRSFLLQISTLDSLSGAVCDAVTGRTDSADLLDELVASGNLFVSAVPSRGPGAETVGYRLHRIFAELLLADLRRVGAVQEAVLRHRAATWYEEHGEIDLALRQALRAGDVDLGSEIVFRHFARAMQRGESVTLERWLSSFPGVVLASDGLLSVAAGWLAMVRGDGPALLHHLEVARNQPVDGVLPDGTASHEVAVAALEAVAGIGGVLGTARSAAIVVAAGPTGSPWWQVARQVGTVALVAAGDVEPEEVLNVLELDTRGAPAVHSVAVAHLALHRLRSGDPRGADRLASESLAEASRHGMSSYSLIGMIHCIASLTAAAVEDRARSVRLAVDAVPFLVITEQVNSRAGVHARQLLAEAALLRGELDEASSLLRSARTLLASEPDAARLSRDQDEIEGKLCRMRAHRQIEVLTPAELRVLRELPTHRSLEEIGDRLYISRNTVKSHAKSIYRKLGVSGRSDAVERAEQLALLGHDDRLTPSAPPEGSTPR